MSFLSFLFVRSDAGQRGGGLLCLIVPRAMLACCKHVVQRLAAPSDEGGKRRVGDSRKSAGRGCHRGVLCVVAEWDIIVFASCGLPPCCAL